MRIRKFRSEDATAVARLHRETIRHINSNDYPEDIIKVWSGRVTAKKHRDPMKIGKKWVAVLSRKIVGFVNHSLKGEFWGLYVHKDHQGEGIGSKLLQTAEDSLKKMGVRNIQIVASVSAKKFYERKGYKVIKKQPHLMENKKMVSYLMEKRIINSSKK